MIEAFACGTPVVAWRRGSVSELVEHGVTGYVVDDLDAAVDAVSRLDRLDRAACRRAFEARFDAARMARDYVDVYQRIASLRHQ
jgi:glycosyltransferase involved in cell wall biosynthesis